MTLSANPQNTSDGDLTSEHSALGRIRDYVILERLGEGGMGEVYKALHSRLGKTVALKLLPRERTKDSQAVARFEREMLAIGRFDHPNIVKAFDAGEFEGMHFLVMEYVPGCDVAKIIDSNGRLAIADACGIVAQAASALQHVFTHGLVHRDIKPSNLMLTADGLVKILDLGLALLQQSNGNDASELTTAGQAMGTLDYMAPEQCDNSHTVDIRADIYALGATLYKLISGRAPYADTEFNTPIKKLTAIATLIPPRLKQIRSDVPEQLSAIVERMMAKDPEQRYATPAEVAAALEPLAEGSRLSALFDVAHIDFGPQTSGIDTTVTIKTLPYEKDDYARSKRPPAWPHKRRAVIGAIVVVTSILVALWQYVIATRRVASPARFPASQSVVEKTRESGEQDATGLSDASHGIAAAILAKRGRLNLQAGNATFEVTNASQLPGGNFSITAINLSDTPLKGVDLSRLGALGTLRSLLLHRVDLGDSDLRQISKLTNLEELALDGTQFSDSGVIQLAALDHLKTLNLKGTRVTVAGVAKLQQALHDCWIESPQTVDLLSMIDPLRDAVSGEWRLQTTMQGKELVSPNDEHGRLQIPYHPPGEYRLRAVMTRISAPALFRQFCLTLAHESTQPQFVADEWQFPEKSYVSGFQIIDSKLLISRENAHRGEILKTNEPVTLLITVYDQGFAISCDGKLIDEHTAGYHNVVRNGHYAIPDVRAIGIDADRCGFRITSLDLTPLVADSDSQHIWPVTADFRAAVWASVAPSDKGGELRGPILGRKKPIDGRPIWELSGQKFFVHSINVAGKKHVRDIGLKSLEGLSELNELNLSDTQVTDAGLVHLKGLTSLKKLDLSGTKITRAGYEILKAALPECEISWDSGKQSP